VKGCPLKVTVTSTCDPSKVVCSGEGLKWGIIGKEIKSFIDTRKSGPGKKIQKMFFSSISITLN
jgi:filamin